MSFFASGRKTQSVRDVRGAPSLDLMHRLECKVCPLKNPMFKGRPWKNHNPDSPASGSERPYIYVLGEAPGAHEDEHDSHFTGKSGAFLRTLIPHDWLRDIRFNNVVRTRPPENRTPEHIEIECCRPSVVRDIEATQPKAIFGFGAIALEWATGQTRLNNWRGRWTPVKIGKHECWYFAFHHPSYIIRLRGEWEEKRKRALRDDQIGPEDDRVFRFDVERAFRVVSKLPEASVISTKAAMEGVEWIDKCDEQTLSRIERFLEEIEKDEIVGLDYETRGLRPYAKTAQILTIAVAREDLSLGFPLHHPQATWSQSQKDRILKAFREMLYRAKKAVHNAPFELEWTGVQVDADALLGSRWDDTMTQAALLDERTGKGEGAKKREQGPLSLDFLCRQYFGLGLKAMSKVDTKNLANEPLREVVRYNALDSKFHRLLYFEQDKRLDDEGFRSLYEKENEHLPGIVRTQMKGLPVDQGRVEELSDKYEKELARLDKRILEYKEVKEFEKREHKKFNVGSNPHVTILVRDIMGRKDGLKELGGYTVEEDTLKKIDTDLTDDILAWRATYKMKSTYNDGLKKGSGKYLHDDGMLHPVITTTTARTGRTASEDPNEQNWPAHDEVQKEVRSQIAVADDELMVAFDYGQIQFRNIAMESRDKALVQMLWERYDVHMDWAERLGHAYPERVGGKSGLKDKTVMKVFRQDVKNKWTFPLCFGSRGESCAEDLEMPWEYVKPEYEEFWRIFHGIRDWHERTIKFYEKNGYVVALDGRRRRAPMSQNQVINSPIQADEACIVKDGQTRVSKINDWDYQSSLLVHDDLTFIFPKKQLDLRCEKVLDRMLDVRHFPWINVPITIEIKVGPNWEVMKGIGDFSSDQWFPDDKR